MTSRTLNGRAPSVWQFLIPLVLITLIYTAARSILSFHGLTPSSDTDLAWSFAFRSVLVGWVYFDRRVREFSVPFEFDAFMFFAWIFLLPYYLFRTGGRRGLLLLAGAYGLTMIPYLVTPIVGALLR